MAGHERLSWLESLDPGYYVMTMATGIISIAFQALDMPGPSEALYFATLLSWCVLFLIYTWRLVRFPRAVWADLINTSLTFNFFSFVAGTCVSGMLLHAHGHGQLALISWIIAFAAWAGLLYCSFGALILLHPDRSVSVVHGGWLICIVGTQSLVLLGLKIVPGFTTYAPHMMVAIFMLWGLGLILYGILVTLISYRIFFREMKKGRPHHKRPLRGALGNRRGRNAHMGVGVMVDPAPRHHGRMAPRRAESALEIRAVAVVNSIPTRHVHGCEHAAIARGRVRAPSPDIARDGLGCGRRMGASHDRPLEAHSGLG